jgi:hypothetical protein
MVCLGLIVTSGSVASWSVTKGSTQGTLPTPETLSSQISASSQSDSKELAPENTEQRPFLATLGSSTPESRLANLILDPDAGGSPEVVYPDPSEPEQQVTGNASAPQNFRITALGDNFVSLSFTPTPNVSLYQVYIRNGDSFTATGAGPDGKVTFNNLAADFDYVACVYSRVDNIESNRACLDIHTTGSRPVEPVKAAAPKNIQLSATETTVTASWDAVIGASWYYVCHVSGASSVQCGGYTHLTPTKAIFQDGSINPATVYAIRVQTVMADGSFSEVATKYIRTPGTPPAPPTKYAAPTNLRITAISTSEVTAAWDYPSDSPITVWSFTVRQLTSYSQTGVEGAARSFTYKDLFPSSGYEVILSGRDANGKSTEEIRLGFYSPAN